MWSLPDGARYGLRAGSARELNVHLHTVVLDGGYVARDDRGVGRERRLEFRPLTAPTRRQLDRVVRGVARRVGRMLSRKGLEDEAALPDAAAAEPDLAALVGEAVVVPRDRLVDTSRARDASDGRFVARGEGFNLHAGVAISALDHGSGSVAISYVRRSLRTAFDCEKTGGWSCRSSRRGATGR